MVERHAAQMATGADALRRGTIVLRSAGIDDAALEAELLLRHVLGLDKTYFYLRLPESLTAEQQRAYEQLLARRLAHEPTAYLTGHREFYGLDFHVGPGVLIPRPETEMVVEESLRQARARAATQRAVVFVDVGTGSGAIAIAVAKHAPEIDVYAIDQAPEALAIAQYNARRLRVAGRVRFLQGDLLAPMRRPADVVAANLPYIPSTVVETLAPEVQANEPRIALDGGDGGLTVIRRLLAMLRARTNPGGVAILETAYDQGEAVRALAEGVACGPVSIQRDLAGHERVVVVPL